MALDKLWRNDIISKFKRNLVILSLLILALCMGVTSAANDVSAESMMICDNNGDALLEVSENIGSADIIGTSGGDNYALGDDSQGNFAELNSTICAYGDNANILLNKDYVFSDDDIDFNNGIVISHNNLTIDGQGHFIDGSNLARIFYVSEGVTSFTLKDVTLQNAYATTGSAIYFVDRMTNVEIAGTFSDNTQRQNGAIYFADGVSGNVVLDGDFTNNNAVSGNVGVLNFGTVYAGSNVFLKGNYRNNTCKGEMAVAYFPVIEEGATVVLEGAFSGNYNGGNPYGAASVAYFGYLNGNAILNGTFTNNCVPSSGGIAYVNTELNGNLILDGVFTNNNANNGGIISIAPIVNGNIILNGTFINNSASNVGGIINFANVINGDVNFTGTFTDNNASSGAVAYMNNKINGNVFVSGNFTNNTGNALISLKDAGTFDNVHSTIPSEDIGVRTSISATVPASMYEGNKLRIIAKLNGIYEALWTNDYKGTVINLTVNNKNYQAVLNESGYGEFIIDDLNTAGVYEVKVFYEGNETYLPCENLYNLTVLSSADHKSFTDLYEAINNNTDGVIYLDGTYIFDFVNDAHLQNGIGIYVNMVIDGQGKTVIDGAGLARIFNLNSDVSEFTLKNIIVKNAKAGNGAVIMCNAALDTLVLNGTFNNNYATGSGSVVYSGSTIGDCIVDGVYYNNTGSIISIFGGNAAIMGNFTENTADYGPVLRGSGFNGVLSGYFKDNHATNCGGVAHITQNCTIILNGTFIGNNATNYGGVFSTYRGMTYLEFSGIFENNSAGVAGGVGAIPMSGGAYYSEDILLTGDFNGNSAPDAAVLWTGERASINNILVENAAFTNNTAENGNILVLNNFNVGDIDNTDFIDNNAIESIIYTNNPINIRDNVKFENNIGGEISNTVLTSLTVTLSSSQIYDNRDVEAYVTLEGLKDYSNQKIKLYISDDYYQDVLLNDEGSANVTLPHLRKDVYVISAYYEGNNYYLASQDSKILKVIPSTDSYAFKMLNETINNNTDGVVYLDANYIFDPVADADLIEGIVIDRDIVIDGRGNTIDGASLSRIFYLTSDVKNFKLVNVTVQNAKAQSGAVIYSNTTLDTLVLNGTFTNNYATDSGSVVYSSRITDSTLDGTYYKNHAGSNGGVINTAGTVNLIGNFTENYANSYGGVLSGSANAVLSGYFKDNYASSQSGGVAHTSLANANMILNGTFIGNRANNYGGVFSSYRGIANAELSGTFENNSAGVAGGVGAMPVSGGAYPSNNVLLTGDFTGNSAPNAAILWTGDRASVNSLVVENATFTNNTATNGGTLVLNNIKEGEIKNSTFTENKAKTAGAMLLNTDNVNVENNTFENNIATIEGQNIISIGNNTFGDDNIYDGLLVLNKTSLALNLSSDSIPANKKVIITVELAGLSNYTNVGVKLNITPGRQESILLNENGIGSIEIANLSARVYEIVAYYEGNTQYAEVNSTTKVLTVLNATNTLSFTDLNETINNNSEAVIYLDGNYTFDSAVDTDLINGIVIDRDIVIDGMGNTIDGAALSRIFYLTENVKNFELRNVTVKNAKADNGAVIRVNGSLDTFVLNGTFTDNYATGSGSVLYSANAINDCILGGTYYKNHAGSNGGVIYLSGGNVSLVGNFTENYANSYGGVLNGAVNLVLSGYFEDNYAATQSGGVAHISSSTNTVLNGTFIGNNANKYGGVFSTYRGMRSVDLSGTFEDNSAGVAGGVGAISIGGAYSTGNITLTGEFTGNNAPNAAILWTDNNGDSVNSVIIENATVTDNDATTGGIIELRNVKDANISNSNFTGNYAPLGVVYITGTDIDINEINLTDNTGNGINVNSTDAYLSNITIDNVDEGNAIVVNGDNTIIDNVNINNVGDDYSAIDVNGDGAFIINSNIGNAGIGVNVNGNNVNIGDNNITYSDVGVKLNGNDAVVYGNNVTNNTVGILINANDTEIVDNYFYDNIQDISIDKNSNRNNPLYKNQLKSENYPRENISVGTDPNLEITNVTSDAIDVALPDDAKGYLLVDIDGIGYYKPVNGNVTFDVPDNLDPGVHVVDITYSGDGNYAAAATSVDLTVPKRDAYTFETIGDTVNYGENAVISIVLPDDANGTVFAIVDNIIKKAEVVNGRANITLPVLSVGEYNFTVEYSGDDNYEGSATTAFVSITKITPDIEINITPEESDVGDTVQVIVTFPDNVANNVVVRIAGKTYSVASGEVIEITNLTAGDYDVIAIYDGDDIYYDNMNYASFKVIARQDANITIDDVEVPVGENATIEVTLTEDATGEVTVTVNGENYTVPVKDGKASVAIPELPAGNYNVTVTYSGDDNYRSSSVNSTLDVVTVYSADIVKIFHNDTQFTALFLDNNGTPLANTTVSFKINGRTYKRTTNESGWAKFNINLGPGEYDLTAINPVTGEEKLNTVTVLTNLETSDLTKYFMNASQFIVRAILPNGSYAGAGEKIRFNINGRFYARTTDDNGYAILNINLPPGEYTITTYYGDYSVGNTISVLPILTADDLVMVHGDGSKFTVKLLDGLGIGQVITFNINGVFYNRTTDSNGEAKLAINLPAGEYIITSMYNDASTSNTIKIS